MYLVLYCEVAKERKLPYTLKNDSTLNVPFHHQMLHSGPLTSDFASHFQSNLLPNHQSINKFPPSAATPKAWRLYEVLRGVSGLNNKCWLHGAEPAAHLCKGQRGQTAQRDALHPPPPREHQTLYTSVRSEIKVRSHVPIPGHLQNTQCVCVRVFVCVSDTTSKHF